MKIFEIKELYNNKKISKEEFIDKIFEKHSILNEYVDFLHLSGISEIRISDNGLFFTSRKTPYHSGGIQFLTDIVDKRVTPLEAFNFGKYESEDSEMLFNLIEGSFTVFDIGANIGWYTNHLAKILKDGSVFAFEPIPDTFNVLKQNVKINKFDNIILNNLALSDKKEELTFYYSSKMTGASSSQKIINNEDIIELKCNANTLDNYMNENNLKKIDFIKCDVEGAELFTFKGAINTLSIYKPIVFTEMLRKWSAKFNYHPNDIIDLFKSINYSCFINKGGKLIPLEIVDDETVETNFFFLHEEKHSLEISTYS